MTMVDPVVEVPCIEGDNYVVRRVYPMQLTPQNLKTFWEKARQFRTVFGEQINNDFEKFVRLFITSDEDRLYPKGLFWVVDDFVGVFYLTRITEVEAQCHYTFFDRRHKGREDLTRSMLRHVFRRYGFRRLNVEIPMYASKSTFGFTFALGFKEEGRKRKCVEYKDDWFDALTLGILREEALSHGS